MDMPYVAEENPIALPDGPALDSLSIAPVSPYDGADMVIALPPASNVIPGVIGLQNIGNTCFMNSVLQCLLHCRPLCEYFLSGKNKDEINESNPLGSGGKLVNEFAKLVDQVWRQPPHEKFVTPRDLKWVIGQHAPMFMGYHQHDSQELVTFLLDGLHEDLNLVKNKPYTAAIEAGDRPDPVVARLCWEQHLLRNQSKIVDLFQGQYKSRLRCPHCSKSSVTFDPFMYLSLPIPTHPDLPLLVTFTFAQAEPAVPPIRLAVNVFRDATDLPRAIAAAVASELPSEYSESVSADDILVFSQSTTYSCFQQLEGSNYFSSSSLVAKKKVFCTYAPKSLQGPTSPRIEDESSDVLEEQPFAKRHRNNSFTIVVQTRICEKSKFVAPTFTESSQTTPSLGYLPVGPPTAVCVSNTVMGAELLTQIKRAVLYSVGSRSNNILEGMRAGSIVRVIENGSTVKCAELNGEDLPENFVPKQELEAVNLFVDIPVDDSVSAEEDAPQSWEDKSSDIQARIADYHRTERSWRVLSVSSAGSYSSSIQSKNVNISDCFRLFSSEEVLGETDQWYCSDCKEHVQASKKLDLWSMPEILIVHLKRFQYSRGFRNKIDSVVDFPTGGDVLDVSEYLPEGARASNTNSLQYQLFSISNHTGSLYSGHYTAYAKLWEDPDSPTHRRKNEHWYSFNDSYVSEMDEPPQPDSSAYLLFYRRLAN